MVLLTRHEESIKARLWFAFQWSGTTFTTYESLWTSSSSSFAKNIPKFFGFPNLENCAIHLFHFLLPLPKRIPQGLTAWILFVFLFSLFQKNKGLTTWILLSLFSLVKEFNKTQSENSFDSPLSHIQKISKD